MYKEIKSKYIRDKIGKTKWKNREYIHSLIRIEWLAQGITFGMTTGYAWMNLPRMYPAEWEAIWTELNPEGYADWLRDKEREVAEEQQEIKRSKEEEEARKKKAKAEWKEMGGGIMVVLRWQKVSLEINERQLRLLKTLRPGEATNMTKYRNEFAKEIKERQARMDLKGLVDLGYLRVRGKGRSTEYVRGERELT